MGKSRVDEFHEIDPMMAAPSAHEPFTRPSNSPRDKAYRGSVSDVTNRSGSGAASLERLAGTLRV